MLKERITRLISDKRGQRWILAIGIAGMVLILLSNILPKREKQVTLPASSAAVTAAEYAADMEAQLTSLVSSMEGVGACRVMVTLENGVEYIYANEERSGSDSADDGEKHSRTDDLESSAILVETADGYTGLLVTELQPTVRGVVVVCEGGGDAAVCERVTRAVMAAANVTARRVCVVAGNGNI